MTTLWAGAGKRDITPDWPVELGGYAHRAGLSDGVADRLHGRALALREGGRGRVLVLLSLDLLAVDAALNEQLNRAIAPIAPEGGIELITSATHTHHGPDGFPAHMHLGLWRDECWLDAACRDHLVGRAAAAIAQAVGEMRPCEALHSDAPAIFGGNRRGGGEGPARAQLLRFAAPDGTVASLVHYPCHPTAFPRDSRLISADFPGAACAALEEALGGVCLFFNGGCGDISTRFTRRPGRDDEHRRFGLELASGFLSGPPETPVGRGLWLRRRSFDLGGQAAPMALISIGQWRSLAVPGELFYAVACRLIAGRGLFWVWGFAIDYMGYLPDEPAFDQGGYEVEVARVDRAAMARWICEVGQWIDGACDE